MTLTGIGPFWLYQSILSFFSPTTKEKQDDETLTRIYICNYKTLLINRAGKHHRGFYLSSYPRNCSLLIFHHILDTLNIIHQSINLRGIFSLQLKHTNYSLLVLQFSLDKKRGVSCYQLVLDQFVCFDELSRQLCSKMLAHFASLLNWQSWQFLFHSLLSSCKNVQKHPMARAALYFWLNTFDFFLYSCWPHQTCSRIQNWISLLLGAFRMLGSFTSKQQYPRNSDTPRNPTHGNGNLWMTMNSIFWLDVSKKYLKWMWVCEIVLHSTIH